MMLRQYFTKAVLLLFFASISSSVLADNEKIEKAVKQTVESYCKIEFDGAWLAYRSEIVKFSPKRKAERSLHKDADAAAFELQDHYPFIVISAYDVQEVHVLSPTRAAVKVAYHRVADSKSDTGKDWYLVADREDNDHVTLNLVFEQNKWWIMDPPPPRISKDVLIRYYERKFNKAAVNTPLWHRANKILTFFKSL